MNWTSVLFLLAYWLNATQNGFRLYVQFEQKGEKKTIENQKTKTKTKTTKTKKSVNKHLKRNKLLKINKNLTS